MEGLDEIIAEATAAISEPYFHLPIFGGPPVWRERVYCYELYHQIRLRWPADSPVIITGEVDKRAHPIFEELAARQAIPDLLVHAPGDMGRNHAVIEVKSQQAKTKGIEKDVTTLQEFRDIIGYQRAIYLVFGADLPQGIVDIPDDIELWHHFEVGRSAQLVDRA